MNNLFELLSEANEKGECPSIVHKEKREKREKREKPKVYPPLPEVLQSVRPLHPPGISRGGQVNNKRMLCKNINNPKGCPWGNKCRFAHELSEQKIDPIRHKVYTILRNTNDLSHLDLVNDSTLYETLKELTNLCPKCVKHKCSGGYNCRNGALSSRFRICLLDLQSGSCSNSTCSNIHLTRRGLIPFNVQNKPEFDVPETAWANAPPAIFLPERKPIVKFVRTQEPSDIPGILLNDKYMSDHYGGCESESSDENFEAERRFLNDLDTDMVNRSIFDDDDSD